MKRVLVRMGLALCGMLLVANAQADINTTCSATLSSPKAAQISKSTTNTSTAIQIDVLSATPVTIGGWGLGYGPVPKIAAIAMALTSCTKNGAAIAPATTAVLGDVISCPITAVGGTGIEVALFDTSAGVTSGAGIIDIHQFMTACTAGKGTYWKPPTTGTCAASLQASACITQPLLPPVLGMAAGSPSAIVGSNVTFTLSATNPNTATALSNVVVSDVIPTGMTYVSSAPTLGSVTVVGQTLSWIIPSLPVGGTAQLNLVVQPTAKGSYTNTATSVGATSASATILVLPSAITRYSMDETVGSWTGASGEVVDSGGNALNGHRRTVTAPTTTNTVAPNPTIASQYPAVRNGFCNAGRFDGNAVVESASSTFFQFTNKLSASAWIYPTAYPTGTNGQDLSSILSNDTNYEFHLTPQKKLFWWWGSATLTSAATIPLNQWTHVAITMDSSLGANSRQRIYINGVEDTATNNWSGTLTKNNCPFYIGGDIHTNSGCTLIPERNFHGMIDEAKIYDYELSGAEVQADMTLGHMCTSSGTFDHIRIEHDGSASTCASKTVTLKACMDAACTSLYAGAVTLTLSPAGWTPADTITFSGGVTTATLSQASIAGQTSITLNATGISPPPAGATRCFIGATETSCTISVANTSCKFDATEVGVAYPQAHLYTKLAGTAFKVDILALAGTAPNFTVDTAYNRTVSVDLVDTSTALCSATSPALSAAQNVALASGRATTALMTSATSASSVQVRIQRGGTLACSTDKFVVRPLNFTVTSTDATNVGATATPAIVAGAPFNLTAASVVGYNGTPVIDQNGVVGTAVAGTLVGVFNPAVAASGTASGNSFTYDEVGNFGLNQNAVYDKQFTAVDQASGDCVVGSFSNTPDASGKYGCSIGSVAVPQTTGSSGFGRFIPDHFDTAVVQSSNVPMPCPTNLPAGLSCPTSYNGFVYSGQPFSVQVTAKSRAGKTTANYAGAYAHAVTLEAWDALGSTTTKNPSGAAPLALVNGTVPAASFSSGSATTATPVYNLANAMTAPTDIFMRAFDAEATSLRASNPTTTSVEGGVKVANGRIKISNAYGSELLPLVLTANSQYYAGAASGWLNSSTDGVTSLPALTTVGSYPVGAGTTAVALTPGTGVMAGGKLIIKLNKPSGGASGKVTIGDATHPVGAPGYMSVIPGTATFGVYKGANEFIYIREY